MDICPVIEIFPDQAPLFADSNGRIILDISEATSISLNKSLYKDDVLLIESDPQELSVTIPNTPKNYFYLKSIFDPNTEKSNGGAIVTRITVGSETLVYDIFYGVQKNNSDIQIKFKVENNWIEKLREKKLKDIGLPDIDFTRSNVEDKWTNNNLYNDGDDGYWFPLVFFGAWQVPHGKVVVEDLRPHLHATFLLQKMFESIGWCIESPFYETSFGRKLITYLLSKDYNNRDELNKYRVFVANKIIEQGQPLQGVVTDWNEIIDYGNSFDGASGIYNAPFEGKFVITFKIPDILGSIDVELKLLMSDGGAFTNVLYQENFGLHTGEVYSIEVPVTMLADQSVELSLVRSTGNHLTPFDINVTFSNYVERTIYSKGDVIPLSKEVDEDLSCWDVFVALQHLMYGIVEADYTTKTVRLLTPYDADIFGEPITGYFNNTLVDLIAAQPINTATSLLNNPDILRNVILAFAESTDFRLKGKRRDDGIEYFAKAIELSESFNKGTTPDRNPLFEGTLNQFVGVTYFLDGLIYRERLHLPVMIDNDENKISYDIQPRIIYAAGEGIEDNILVNGYSWETEIRQLVAYAYQDHGNVSFNGSVPDERLIYGDNENDLWSLVYSRFYMQYNAVIKIDLINNLNHRTFFGFDLKKLYQIEYDGHPVSGRILSIADFQPCNQLASQLILLPDVTTEGYCLESDPPENCNNVAFITVESLGTCQTYSIGGEFDCDVLTICWEIQYASDENFSSLGCSNTIQICDASESYIVRAVVTYDCECPDSTVTKQWFPCSTSLLCEMHEVFNDGVQCLAWSYTTDEETDCVVAAYVDIYVHGDLIDTIILDEGELICPIIQNALYILHVTLECENGCDDLTTECDYVTTGQPPQCANFPVLICVPVSVDGVQCYEFAIGGTMSQPYETFTVTVQCDNEIITWFQGDDPICCSGTLTATAMVFYCDCPAVCTDEVSCSGSGCTEFNAGTAIPFIMCN